jgi:2-polyprenyl-3-methyl-5-hydroxy-6-metoxy-1,4-benzoquinol methylase
MEGDSVALGDLGSKAAALGRPEGGAEPTSCLAGASQRMKPMRFPFTRLAETKRSAESGYMELRPCPICGGERSRPLLEHKNFQFYTDAAESKQATIRQVQCLHCFAVFMNPTFTQKGFAVLFAEAGASYGSTSSRQTEEIGWLQERGLLEPDATLLDIGCYEGSFLGKLPPGVKGIGVDIDEPAIERAKRHFGPSGSHRFICADFERFDVDEAIDVITMFHVLEHLPRPVEVLKRLRHLAGPRTHLLVEVPVVENVIFGDACGFLTVQHLTHFSIASLHNVLHAAGWQVITHCAMDGYNGFRVLAEPGPTQANRPEPKDVGLVLNYLGRWYGALSELDKRLRRLTAPHCVLRGGGLQTEYLFHLTSLTAAERKFLIVDNDPLKQGKTWRGIDIVGTDCLASLDWRDTQIVLSSYSHQDAMRDEARSAGIPETAVVSLYDRVWRY